MRFFLLFFIALSIGLKAQLTLTKSFNSPVSGNIFYEAYYDSTSAVPRNTGVNQVWNFTALVTGTAGLTNTTYTTPASVPGVSSAFPSSNLLACTTPTNVNTNYFVYNSNATNDALLGRYSPSNTPYAKYYSTPLFEYNYPFTYNSVTNCNTTYTNGSGTTYTINSVTNGTGTGTLMLPGGNTYANCLQLRSKVSYTVKTSAAVVSYMVRTIYYYFSPTNKFPLLTFLTTAVTASGNTTKTTEITINTAALSTTALKRISNENAFYISPNPAKNNFSIFGAKNFSEGAMTISDITGKIIKKMPLSQECLQEVDITNLVSGLYFVTISNNYGTETRKLIVQN
jgi:hypothetical protein